MKINYKILITLIIVLTFTMIGCQNTADSNQPQPENSASNQQASPTSNPELAYPAPQQEVIQNESYPIESYPIESEWPDSINKGPDFKIDEPIKGGQTRITGNGPAGIPITLINVSTGGTLLGETTIEQDGSFNFNLQQPVESGHAIGLQLGDISGTDLNQNDFIYNDTYYDRPIVGILFDMVTVE
jgi:uncharacterized lipoprotein NlpE involved in copper resistance